MQAVSIKNLCVDLGDFHLRNINFKMAQGEILAILGPSGAGKTILLESIGGFYPPRSGSILLGGRDITYLPPERRKVSIIFQDYALFPHLTVQENILFSSKGSALPTTPKFVYLIKLLNLKPLFDRFPSTLSGGEKQRVSIARALITEPQLLLFDEPLSALDQSVRENLREELKGILKKVGQTSLYVTHDRVEASVLGDRIGVMQEGEILQTGTPEEVFYQPDGKRVADFVGVENILKGKIKEKREGLSLIEIRGKIIQAISAKEIGEEVTLFIRSENVFLELPEVKKAPTSVKNSFPARITAIKPSGPLAKISLAAGFPLQATITRSSRERLNLTEGKEVIASFKATSVHVV